MPTTTTKKPGPKAGSKKAVRKAAAKCRRIPSNATSTEIVRRHFKAYPKRTFTEVRERAIADGVNPNTASGLLVRMIAARRAGAKA